MTGWVQRELRVAKREWNPKFQAMFAAVSRKSSRHQFGRNRGQYYFSMIPNMVAVRMGDERRPLLIPWVEPKIQTR
jgi:hypothetical protein